MKKYRYENDYKTDLCRKLKKIFPGSFVVHLDPNEIQGIPDILILYGNKWATLEGKINASASYRPNQEYYIDIMNKMSFSSVIYPEIEDEVIDALDLYFAN